MTIAKLPLAKDVDDFVFKGTPINEALVRGLAGGAFLAEQRNAVLIGATGPFDRLRRQEPFLHLPLDLVNRLEVEARAGRQGRISDYLTRMDFVILDEIGYLPFA